MPRDEDRTEEEVTLPDRFWDKVNKDGPIHPILGTRCWVWTAAKFRLGYGNFHNGLVNISAHVASWQDENGPVPQGHELDHLCRVPACCRPSHLDPVTHAENIRRGRTGEVTKARHAAKTHCPAGHQYNEENTMMGKQGKNGEYTVRRCKICCRAAVKEYNKSHPKNRKKRMTESDCRALNVLVQRQSLVCAQEFGLLLWPISGGSNAAAARAGRVLNRLRVEGFAELVSENGSHGWRSTLSGSTKVGETK
jgi:hypothetical protein